MIPDSLSCYLPSPPAPSPIRVTEDQAVAMFIKYGCDSQGLLPYDMFAARLLSSPARLLALEPEQKVHRGIHPKRVHRIKGAIESKQM